MWDHLYNSKELGAIMTIARKIAIIASVLKNTFGLILLIQDDVLEGIDPPDYFLIKT